MGRVRLLEGAVKNFFERVQKDAVMGRRGDAGIEKLSVRFSASPCPRVSASQFVRWCVIVSGPKLTPQGDLIWQQKT